MINLTRNDIEQVIKEARSRNEKPDLSSRNLGMLDLNGMDFRLTILLNTNFAGATLKDADFRGADLRGADLTQTNLNYTNLTEVSLSRTLLIRADATQASFVRADLGGAVFKGANLRGTNFREADLRAVNFTDAYLVQADLSRANLGKAQLQGATMGWTILVNVNLKFVKGLGSIKHIGPSTIDLDTIYRSQGKIPNKFLRGAGVRDTFINYLPDITRKPIEYHTCFISYASKDKAFAMRLFGDLQQKGVRCWFAPENMKIGDEIRSRIDESIKAHDRLLLILSQYSINSEWVKKEVETAFEEENKHKEIVLFPIRLDDAVMETDEAWAADIRRTRHIGDFRQWKNHDAYQEAFHRLLRDLEAED